MKKRWIALIILCLAILGGLLYVFRPGRQPTYTTTSVKEPERGGSQATFIDSGSTLGGLLLKEQYVATRDAVVAFATLTYGQSVKTVRMVGEPTLRNDGVITFTAQAVEVNKQFTALVTRNSFDTIIFSVPASGYSRTIDVYGSAD